MCLLYPAFATAQAPAWQSVHTRSGGAKTLFTWNGQQAVDDGPDDPRLVTDRPHFSEASSLVGLGVVQIETGYSIFSNRANGTRTTTHSFPEPLLRMGVFAEWFEFRLASNYLVEHTSANTGSRTVSGTDDMYLGAKVALAKQAGVLPELAVFPQMRLPTGKLGLLFRPSPAGSEHRLQLEAEQSAGTGMQHTVQQPSRRLGTHLSRSDPDVQSRIRPFGSRGRVHLN